MSKKPLMTVGCQETDDSDNEIQSQYDYEIESQLEPIQKVLQLCKIKVKKVYKFIKLILGN